MAWFRILYTRNAFERSLDGSAAAGLTPAEGLRAMAAFYREHRAQHASVPDGDDVLEFRWATADEHFEVAVRRRLRRHGSDAPERVLELAWRFPRSGMRDAAASGRLSITDPVDARDFVRRVTGSAPWKAIRGSAPLWSSISEA